MRNLYRQYIRQCWGASIWMHTPKVYTDMYDHEIIRTELQIVCVDETAEEILALIND